MRFVSQLTCFPVGAHSQSETPAGQQADTMGNGKGALGSRVAGSTHPVQPALEGLSWEGRHLPGDISVRGAGLVPPAVQKPARGKLSRRVQGSRGDEPPVLARVWLLKGISPSKRLLAEERAVG